MSVAQSRFVVLRESDVARAGAANRFNATYHEPSGYEYVDFDERVVRTKHVRFTFPIAARNEGTRVVGASPGCGCRFTHLRSASKRWLTTC